MKRNTLYYGDCLEVMDGFDDRSVDLIYLDRRSTAKPITTSFSARRKTAGTAMTLRK